MSLTFNDGVHITSLDYFIRTTLKGDLDPGVQPFYRGVGRHYDKTRPSVSVLRISAITKRYSSIRSLRGTQLTLLATAQR